MGIVCLLSPDAQGADSGHTPVAIFLTALAVLAVVAGRLKEAFHREQALRENLDLTLKNARELEGLLPVCAWCKKVRNEEGSWQELGASPQPRIKAAFSHGICPECAARLRTENEQRA